MTLVLRTAMLAWCTGCASVATAPNPFAGQWDGIIDGHASFATDWETEPYCSGDISADVDDDGSLFGTGFCQILWGPFVDETFDVTFSGVVDVDVMIAVQFDYPTHERDFLDATIAGPAAQDLDARGGTQYLYQVLQSDQDAIIVAHLER